MLRFFSHDPGHTAPAAGHVGVAMLLLCAAGLTGCPLEQYYNDPAAYARGQAAVRETFQPDVLFGPLVVAALAEAFGSRVRYSDKVAPVVSAPAIGSAAEWERLPIPDPDRHPRLLYLREALRLSLIHI